MTEQTHWYETTIDICKYLFPDCQKENNITVTYIRMSVSQTEAEALQS